MELLEPVNIWGSWCISDTFSVQDRSNIFKCFKKSLLCSPLIQLKYSENCNIMKYYHLKCVRFIVF